MTDVHLINHTHWDREWFLTQEYTTAWVPELIDSLVALVEENPDYEFLFDGQTLAIEDLLKLRPEYRERVAGLVSSGALEIGPCYSQPDWRITSGELHVRNLQLGGADAAALGGSPDVAWLVDTFGHISQAPQLLNQSGINAAFVWRGVPRMEPVFRWEGADGTQLTTIDLFGGYRNLYGVTSTPGIAVHRLVAETNKLAPHYEGLPVPLFDGYDLDTEPEDPATYYGTLEVPENITLHASSPRAYADAVAAHAGVAPVIRGELISGKFGSTFPGSLSARTYLKVLHHDTEVLLHRRLEPMLVAASSAGYEVDWTDIDGMNRELLQNAVHDAICGVSIDQVHERMERSYRRLLSEMNSRVADAAQTLFGGFADGTYAFSTNTAPGRTVLRNGDRAVVVDATGFGITAASTVHPVSARNEPVGRIEWNNDHFHLTVDENGMHVDGLGRLATLTVREDLGDTYSSEPGGALGELTPVGPPVLVDQSEVDLTIRSNWQYKDADRLVTATVDVRVDAGPVLNLTISLDSSGSDFRVDAHFETGITSQTVFASMPFDVVERAHTQDDLFEFNIDPDLAGLLMGQREVGWITEFPCHDFVAMSDGSRTAAVLTAGQRGYRSTSDGTLSIALRRSVEWLAKTGLKLRSGDAGPAMYVPGARCERTVTHQLGVAILTGGIDSCGLTAVSESFKNPPLIVDVAGGSGAATTWPVLDLNLPSTACVPGADGAAAIRVYNPTVQSVSLASPTARTRLDGADVAPTPDLGPKEIATLTVALPDLPATAGTPTVTVGNPMPMRVGPSRSAPDPTAMEFLLDRVTELEGELAQNEDAREQVADETQRYLLTHQEYVLDRERLELELSLELNRRRAATTDVVSIPDQPDPVIATLGANLNDLRVKRRIYDYVAQALRT